MAAADPGRPGRDEAADAAPLRADALAQSALAGLRNPATIRERCGHILQAVQRGDSAHFKVDERRLDAVAERVATLTRARFPDLRVPYHSRWRHFEAGGVDRKGELDSSLKGLAVAEKAHAHIELTLVSVLLDAGAGPAWRYREAGSGLQLARSEGLGVASLRAFMAGRFSSDAAQPCRVDALALKRIAEHDLREVFQVRDDNPLVGLAGRVQLLHRLGRALSEQPAWFGATGRPAGLIDVLTAGGAVTAGAILGALLQAFSTIWPSGQVLHGLPAGDAWPHPAAGGAGPSAGWVPFHKLSQWLSYSLLEPLQWAGVPVGGLDQLTGLPEYRNGGLLLDGGVIVPRTNDHLRRPLRPEEEWVVEWRALTVALLDALAPRVRALLGAPDLPLACILEGGTWAAGRQVAAELRPGGAPPVTLDSDGTLF